MDPSVGTGLNSFPVRGLRKVRDLEFFDGPLLSEFRSPSGDTYLYSWCAAGGDEHRWMVFRTSRTDVAKYTHQRMSLLELVRACQDGFVYLLDVAAGGEVRRVQLGTLEELPPHYLPAEDSRFDPGLMPQDQWTHDILIDGTWSLNELSEFPRRYMNVYSFLYLLGTRPDRPPHEHAFSYDLRGGGGWVHRHFYDMLARQVPKKDLPRLDAIHYSSPGIISIRLNLETADIIPKAIARFSENEAELASLYRQIYRGTHGRIDHDARLIEATLKRLVEMLGFIDWELLRRLTQTVEQLGDVVLAHYRQIEGLFDYQKQDKAIILDVAPEAETQSGG